MVCSSTCTQGAEQPSVKEPAAQIPRLCLAADISILSADPLVVLGLDLFISNVLPRLDAPSLAASSAVCSGWRIYCVSDILWRPFLSTFLSHCAHVPLPLCRSSSPLSPYIAFSIAMIDTAKVEITPEEMCARIWEMKVKPTCGDYWYSLDPTSRGEDPLLRRFHCDQSVTAMQDQDPIWGGQESCWQLVKTRVSKPSGQYVQINSWPQHLVTRLPDGRWRLDNYFASYTTCADQETNMPSYLKGKMIGFCTGCNPEPGIEVGECVHIASTAEASLGLPSMPSVSC